MKKKEQKLGVVLAAEKITFTGKTFAEIKVIAKKNNEDRLKALQKQKSKEGNE